MSNGYGALPSSHLSVPTARTTIDLSNESLTSENNAATGYSDAGMGSLPSSIPNSDKDVCFGMLSLKIWAYMSNFLEDGIGNVEKSVDLVPDPERLQMILVQINRSRRIGSVDPLFSPFLVRVLTTPRIQYQAFIPPFGKVSVSNVPLRIVLYGPYKYGPTVGSILRNGGLELIFPSKVREGKEVHNPHLQPPAEQALMRPILGADIQGNRLAPQHALPRFNLLNQQQVVMHREQMESQAQNQLQAIFSNIISAADLPEWEPSPKIKSTLYPHQKQALYWMIQREKYIDLDDKQFSLTSVTEDRELAQNGAKINRFWKKNLVYNLYVNVLTGHAVSEKPKITRGGIVADDMGLGKTIQILSLILTSALPKSREPQPTAYSKLIDAVYGPEDSREPAFASDKLILSKGTLIVCPLSTVSNWEDQISTHVEEDALSMFVFHGPNRRIHPSELAKYDVVLTTYNVAAIEFKMNAQSEGGKSKDWRKQSILHAIYWRRVVLDEAHIIRNPKTQMSQACVRLESERHWCLTGTPVQNRLMDIFSLLCFLRVSPFDNVSIFKQYLDAPLAQRSEVGVVRLQTMMKAMTLRRVKSQKLKNGKPILELPARSNQVRWLTLRDSERAAYDSAFNKAQDVFKKLCDQNVALKNYTVLLTLVLRLRQLVTYPGLAADYEQVVTELMAKEEKVTPYTTEKAHRQYAMLIESEETMCSSCNRDVLLVTQGIRQSTSREIDESAALMSVCGHLYCLECVERYKTASKCFLCDTELGRSQFFSVSYNAECTTSEAVEHESGSHCPTPGSNKRVKLFASRANGVAEGESSSSLLRSSTRIRTNSLALFQSADSIAAGFSPATSHSDASSGGSNSDDDFQLVSTGKLKSELVTVAPSAQSGFNQLAGQPLLGSRPLSTRGKYIPDFERIPPSTKLSALMLDLRLVQHFNMSFWLEKYPDFARRKERINLNDDGLLFSQLNGNDELNLGEAADQAPKPEDKGSLIETLKNSTGLKLKASDDCSYHADGELKREPCGLEANNGGSLKLQQELKFEFAGMSEAQLSAEVKPCEKNVVYLSESDDAERDDFAIELDADSDGNINPSAANKTETSFSSPSRRDMGPEDEENAEVERMMRRLDFGMKPSGGTPTKSVIFSQWTSMLDTIEPLLRRYGIEFERLDGKMARPARTQALLEFKNSPFCTVMLVSLQAGGVGLNLTSASRIYILEPYWNPAVEQQAVDRVYRLGQRKPVVMVRYVVKKSIEESILQIQQHKLELAALALREHVSEMAVDLELEADSAALGIKGKNRKGKAKRRNWSDLINPRDLAAIREEERKRNRAERMLDLRTLFNLPKT